MKICFKILTVTIIILCLTTCKKYDEGGFLKQTNKNLFGANKVGSKKTWHLKLFEVNGIDSTGLIKGSNFYEKISIEFYTNEGTPQHRTLAGNYYYSGYVSSKNNSILFAFNYRNKNDSIQCPNSDCQRNIFFPEFLQRNPEWVILKLTKKEFIIASSLSNKYKIVLTQ